jgi:uncharacterized protein (DUF305 family)
VTTTTPAAPPDDPADELDDEPDPGSRGPGVGLWIGLAIATLILGGAIGWAAGNRNAEPTIPGAQSADVGFFEDMTTHHNQAVAMASAYLDNGTDPTLRQIANEVMLYQASEIGVMNDWITRWGQSGNAPAVSRWMGMPMTRDHMMGMATEEQMQQLRDARGAELDALFTELLIRHHEGGIVMAKYAKAHAETDTAKSWATAMIDGQKGEIAELNRWRLDHGLPIVRVNL